MGEWRPWAECRGRSEETAASRHRRGRCAATGASLNEASLPRALVHWFREIGGAPGCGGCVARRLAQPRLAALARQATRPRACRRPGPQGEGLARPHSSLPCSPGVQPGCTRRLDCGLATPSRNADFSDPVDSVRVPGFCAVEGASTAMRGKPVSRRQAALAHRAHQAGR